MTIFWRKRGTVLWMWSQKGMSSLVLYNTYQLHTKNCILVCMAIKCYKPLICYEKKSRTELSFSFLSKVHKLLETLLQVDIYWYIPVMYLVLISFFHPYLFPLFIERKKKYVNSLKKSYESYVERFAYINETILKYVIFYVNV